jgi:hypothetical protein
MSLKQASIAVMLAGMWALGGCSNSNSPTSGSAFMLVISATVTNTAMASTITEAQLIVDSGTASIAAPPLPASTETLGTSGQAGPGPHTMAVSITGQTTSPTSYTVSLATVQVFDLNRTLLKTITLPNQTAVLATGGSISYSFSL